MRLPIVLWCSTGKGRGAGGQWRVASGNEYLPLATCHPPLHTLVMSSGNLDQFGVYQKALHLFDRVVEDTTRYWGDRKLEGLLRARVTIWNSSAF